MKPVALDRYFYENRRFCAVGPGRGQTRGSHLADLAALGKAITLCETCSRKFKAPGYRWSALSAQHHFVHGDCDGCKSLHVKCRLFLKGKI